MKIIPVSFLLMIFVSQQVMSQSDNVDLTMIYKIKQEGFKNSVIEELAFGLTDLTGPRLTCSAGNMRGNEWAKKKMEELGLQHVRIEAAGGLTSGGWDNLKTYAAMTSPFNSIGLPGFQFIQDEIEYGRGYHTAMDTYERLVMADLKQNAVITASFIYNAAMRNNKLPLKPEMKQNNN